MQFVFIVFLSLTLISCASNKKTAMDINITRKMPGLYQIEHKNEKSPSEYVLCHAISGAWKCVDSTRKTKHAGAINPRFVDDQDPGSQPNSVEGISIDNRSQGGGLIKASSELKDDDAPFMHTPMKNEMAVDYVHFGFDRDEVTLESRVKLLDLNTTLKGRAITIYGFTDAIGAEKYNDGLAARRAKAVLGYLVSIGYDEKLLTIKAEGKCCYLANNDSADGRAKNRRVEIFISDIGNYITNKNSTSSKDKI